MGRDNLNIQMYINFFREGNMYAHVHLHVYEHMQSRSKVRKQFYFPRLPREKKFRL